MTTRPRGALPARPGPLAPRRRRTTVAAAAEDCSWVEAAQRCPTFALAVRRPGAGGVSAWTERHFDWLLVAPGGAGDPRVVALPAAVLALGRVRQLRLPDSRPRLRRLQNFSRCWPTRWPGGAWPHDRPLGRHVVAIEFVLGFALALAMVKMFRGRGIVMSMLIVPLFISPVIVGQSWALFLQRPFGPADYLLCCCCGHPVTINWLSEAPWNFIALIVADVWQWTPFMFVILLAGLSGHAAAPLRGGGDGRGRRSAGFVYITLPQMGPMILLAVTFRLLDAVKLFDIVFMMTGGGPGTAPTRCPSISTRSDSSSSICRWRPPEAGCS